MDPNHLPPRCSALRVQPLNVDGVSKPAALSCPSIKDLPFLEARGVWPSDYENFSQARDAVARWIDAYNRERPHQALKHRTPHEVRREALESTQSPA